MNKELTQAAFAAFVRYMLRSADPAARQIRISMCKAGVILPHQETTRAEVRACLEWLATNVWGQPVDIDSMLEPEEKA